MAYFKTHYSSFVGDLLLLTSEQGLSAVLWEQDLDGSRVKLPEASWAPQHPILKEAQKQIEEYFEGERLSFELPLDMVGSAFQLKVWKSLLQIPFGQTQSYSELALKIGSPQACRAVGLANSKNPLSIVVPCHRVIGKSGRLVGFAGGLNVKAQLLEHEQRINQER